MKSFGIALLLTLLPTLALASTKICFGSGDAKGERFVLDVTPERAVISSSQDASGEDITNGSFEPPTPNAVVNGRDGVTYLDFDLGSDDGANDLLVDSDLLKPGTTGLAKMRNRGEGYSQQTYFCRDNH